MDGGLKVTRRPCLETRPEYVKNLLRSFAQGFLSREPHRSDQQGNRPRVFVGLAEYEITLMHESAARSELTVGSCVKTTAAPRLTVSPQVRDC